MTTTLGDDRLERVVSAVRGLEAGSVRVIEATARREWDTDGSMYVDLSVVLSDPRGGAVTWPFEDWLGITTAVRDAAAAQVDAEVKVTYSNPSSETDDSTEIDADGADGAGEH